MGKSKYITTPKEAIEAFEQFMSQGLPVLDSKGNELILQEDEEFKQCYDANDSVRSVLPVTWFISNHGNLISVYRGRPEWLLRDQNDKARDTYHFALNGKIKIISSYALVGLVFGSPRFGAAKELLEEDTVYCFGNYGSDTNVQTHHVLDKKNHPELINEPSNLEFITVRAHKVAHTIPTEDAAPEKQHEFMEKFTELCNVECPDSIAIAIRDGDSCKLAETQMIKISKELFEFVQTYMENFRKSLEFLLRED